VKPLFQHIGIYGVGLLGGSLGLALKSVWPESEIVGIGRSAERLIEAKNRGAVDRFTCDPERIDPPLDFLVVCTPVRQVPEHLRQTLPSLQPGAVVTDVGSTKRTVVQRCEALAGNSVAFIGSHPMAGSHETGVKAATSRLFQDKICVVTETECSRLEALQAVRQIWETVGMRVIRMTPEQHDRLTARSSHLPHLIAAALCHVVGNMEPEIQSVLGDGFRDTTRIAAGDPGMWLDICLENRSEILASMQSLQTVLQNLNQWLAQADEPAVLRFLEQAQAWKKSV